MDSQISNIVQKNRQRQQKSGKQLARIQRKKKDSLTKKAKKTIKKAKKQKQKQCQCQRLRIGNGFINTLIDHLPFELHLPSPSGRYNFCGPGTKLAKRLKRNDQGINELDNACKTHDIAYANSSDINERHKADKLLQKAAWKRVTSRDSGFPEKLAAIGVAGAMKIKRKFGMGLKNENELAKTTK